jgi:hypothetical protein
MLSYEKYCQDCKKFNIKNPYKSESDFNRAYGIDQHREPLVITPRNQKRPIKPTFEHYSTPKKKKPVVKKSFTTENHPVPKHEKVAEPKKLSRCPNAVQRTSLKGLSPEEKKAHKRELSRKRYASAKQNGTLKPLSEARLEKQREYAREHYRKNREQRLQSVRIKRQNMTPEQKQEMKAYMSQWQKDNRDHVNAMAREWKKIHRKSKNNTCTLAKAS